MCVCDAIVLASILSFTPLTHSHSHSRSHSHSHGEKRTELGVCVCQTQCVCVRHNVCVSDTIVLPSILSLAALSRFSLISFSHPHAHMNFICILVLILVLSTLDRVCVCEEGGKGGGVSTLLFRFRSCVHLGRGWAWDEGAPPHPRPPFLRLLRIPNLPFSLSFPSHSLQAPSPMYAGGNHEIIFDNICVNMHLFMLSRQVLIVMYMWVYEHIQTAITKRYLCVYTSIHNGYMRVCIHVCVCTRTCAYSYIRVSMFSYIRVSIYFIYTCVYVLHIYVCVCIHTQAKIKDAR